MSEEDSEATLKKALESPKKVEVDGQTVEQHSLSEQIAMDKYLASKRAAKNKGLGIRIFKISPPRGI